MVFLWPNINSVVRSMRKSWSYIPFWNFLLLFFSAALTSTVLYESDIFPLSFPVPNSLNGVVIQFLASCAFSHSLTVEHLLSHALNFYISYPFCSLLHTLELYLPLLIECFLRIRHLKPVHQIGSMAPLSASMIACLFYLETTWKIFSQAWLSGKSCHFFFHMFCASIYFHL